MEMNGISIPDSAGAEERMRIGMFYGEYSNCLRDEVIQAIIDAGYFKEERPWRRF